ncbi:potassium-transporting ATPase subunit KdpA [Mucilaginibacter glaciei]|uniref:Potassium-transporting ATPase potassium-binding subunit n=1 Tax=Mucilaginibacter glaciei TaxID=2772109 RepID=A0A926S0I2_9SPHI|nr:potassium-transporting ATPase subunit KdpA [Mucilaginibacter glaciei]MBD1392033.1 potassium-transporting ATPase subunit A [Mucilaginibacter glaciei]
MYLQIVLLILLITAILAVAVIVGKYMAAVYKHERSPLDFLKQVEHFIFRVGGIDPQQEMTWKQYAVSLLVINGIWWILSFALLLLQGSLPLNPAGNPSMEWSLALNSSISFLTSTNLQHYSGESGATYLTQIAVFTFLQFVSAATSLAAGVAIVRGLARKASNSLGNFYSDLVLSVTRVLLPLCLLAGILLMFCGVPMNFNKPQSITTLQGDKVTVATGPVAAMLPIKEFGSNGGGFFGANDAHPFENPNVASFIIHVFMVLLLPAAFIFFLGYYINQKKFSRMIILIMCVGVVLLTIPIISQEIAGNPLQSKMGISVLSGNTEGKEVRFGSLLSSFYAGINVAIPAGTLVSMHDSYMPLSGISMLLGMQIDAFFGGVGTGWINMLVFVIIAIFMGSLMIGRTPEVFGKKITMRQIQLAMGIYIAQPLICLGLTGITIFAYNNLNAAGAAPAWFSNNSSHNFTTVLYEFTSSFAGNGSGFEGLADNNVFWNLTTAVAMMAGRFIPVLGALAIAGIMLRQRPTPYSAGTLQTDSASFGVMLFFVMVVLQVLSLFPALVLGPINEYLTQLS